VLLLLVSLDINAAEENLKGNDDAAALSNLIFLFLLLLEGGPYF
jgi:hypothetical protein